MSGNACVCAHVEVRGQLLGAGPLSTTWDPEFALRFSGLCLYPSTEPLHWSRKEYLLTTFAQAIWLFPGFLVHGIIKGQKTKFYFKLRDRRKGEKLFQSFERCERLTWTNL